MKNIVIFGAPGAGKGTQSDKMIGKYGFGHISTGDVLRNEIKNGTELGKTAKRYIDDGQLIPDELMADRGHNVAAMIELFVPEDELMNRLILRGQQSGRSDDNEETIKKRLNVYHTQTSPLIDWYKSEGVHHHVEGLGTIDEIFSRIESVIDSL